MFFHSCLGAVADDFNDSKLVYDPETNSFISVPNEENTGSINGGEVGIYMSFAMCIAGIIGAVTYRKVIGAYIAGGIYLVSGICGIALHGNFKELIYYSVLMLALAVAFTVCGVFTHFKKNRT